MKILIVIAGIGPIYGGPSKIVIELAQALGRQGVLVDVVTTNANGLANLDVPLRSWIQKSFYRIQYFPRWRIGDYKLSFSLTKWLFNHVADYDLVHTIAVFSYPVSIAHLACQLHKVPYINNPQGMLEPWALSYKSWKKRIYYRLFERTGLNRANAIQMLNLAEAKNVEPLQLEAPLILIPNGINEQEFKELPDPELFYQKFPHTRDKTLILFLARIDPKKGLDLLAPAFARVYAQFPNSHLIIAGPDNIGFLPTVKNYFSQAGCYDAVTFTGMLTGSLKHAALSAASVYVAPSYSEGFSMSVLEGMASGLPCVITTGCNFPEAGVAQAAHVVDISVDQIANTLIDCLARPEQAKAVGNRARKLIFEKYTWAYITSQIQQVYQDITQKRYSASEGELQ